MMNLIRKLYDRADGIIVRILDGSPHKGNFVFPDIPSDQLKEYYINEYFKNQPSLARQGLLMAYIKLRNAAFNSLKRVYRKIVR